jgi:predicted AAA+ superfamily ATPase
MFRLVENDLLEWKNHPNRKPLLVRGARQVGKSYVVEKFGKIHFDNLITINFEFAPHFISCFETVDPSKIVRAIEAITGESIRPGNTLLFLDELQDCPKALLSLRYFKEKMPELHVIAAGSLLEFALNADEFRKPVGRIQSLYMKPFSFKEFLMASGDHKLLEYLASIRLPEKIETAVHEVLLEKCREYFVLGGMPEVVNYYTQQKKYYGSEVIQATILEYYEKDFPKYNKKINFHLLKTIFNRAPSLVGKRVKFSEIDPNVQARDQKPALTALFHAGLIYPVYHSSASGLSLNATLNEKRFKMLFLDVGLLEHASRIGMHTLLHEDLILLNQGALAEQFVGQELIAYSKNYEKPELYFWEREKPGSQAEVDYVLQLHGQIIPVEVKSGTTGRLRSLHLFMEEKKLKIGVRISSQPLSFHEGILSLPFYMIHELAEILGPVDNSTMLAKKR